VKRSEFIQQLVKGGCVLYRHGSRHDIYANPSTGQKQPVPRHSEIDNGLANHIKKYLGLEKK
jgi:mRNA interferase HicA